MIVYKMYSHEYDSINRNVNQQKSETVESSKENIYRFFQQLKPLGQNDAINNLKKYTNVMSDSCKTHVNEQKMPIHMALQY
jgi:hypothetical protein